MSGPRGRQRRLSEGERILWREITRSIAPLRTARADDPEPAEAAPAAAPVRPASPSRKAVQPVARPVPAAPPAPSPAALGRRTKQRLARGRDSIDGRLDLHGLTQAEAHDALLGFLRQAQARGARLVMVITGKGRGGEGGVLKRQVPLWLALPAFRILVVGFDEAHRRHGGEGALYLRLRRAK